MYFNSKEPRTGLFRSIQEISYASNARFHLSKGSKKWFGHRYCEQKPSFSLTPYYPLFIFFISSRVFLSRLLLLICF